MEQRSQRLSVPSSDQSARLEVLKEMRHLQTKLERLFDITSDSQAVPAGPLDRTETEVRVRNIIRLRRRRERLFGSDLFAEPAWDMLLELYAEELAQRRECVSSLCYASGVPPTTALRWITLLEKTGWFARCADPLDQRRTFLSLTPKAAAAMDCFFAQPELAQII